MSNNHQVKTLRLRARAAPFFLVDQLCLCILLDLPDCELGGRLPPTGMHEILAAYRVPISFGVYAAAEPA